MFFFVYLFNCVCLLFLQGRGKVETHRSWSGVLVLWKNLCKRVQTKVIDMGFGLFFDIPLLKADKALLMALVERWSPITHTFHLPMGEIGVTPKGFYMVTRLPMGGAPPPYEVMPSIDMIRKCLGPQPLHFNRGFRGILPSWFEKEYIWAIE